ncbi:MAG: putative porin, partial [Verrucomicrobia bacterium]|nr:putative porin [Verrucomicrobiota bacterium]
LYNYIGLEPNTANGANNGLSALTPYYGDPYIGEGAYYYYASGYSGTARGYSGYNPGQQFGNVPADASYGFPFNQVGLDHLLVLEIPFELRFPISRFDAGLFGDFAYNLEGADRAKAAAAAYSSVLNFELGQNPTTALSNSIPAEIHDVKAWQFGFEIGSRGSLGLVNGEPSHRHAWEIKTYWQHIEQYALDPNILDTDFFEGRENMEGIYMAASFALTEDLIATVRYGHASRINPALGTGGSNQDIPQINPINSYDLYQFDLTLKF